jgi:hypothetical protein
MSTVKTVTTMFRRILPLLALFVSFHAPASAQWSLQVLKESRTFDTAPSFGSDQLNANAFILERNVSFLPFLRLSARISAANFEQVEQIVQPISQDILAERKLGLQEYAGTAMLGLPLGKWLRIYGGYGWVYENIQGEAVIGNQGATFAEIKNKNFAFATVYGARVYLGRYLSVNYEVRELEYENELPTNAKKRSAVGVALHF